MSRRILVTYSSNWADEFDVVSSLIMTREEWKMMCEYARSIFKYKDKIEHYVGSNQEITYTSFEEWFDCYSVSELTKEECTVLNKFKDLIDNNKFFIPEFCIEDYEPKIES